MRTVSLGNIAHTNISSLEDCGVIFIQGLNSFNRIKFMVSATEILSAFELTPPYVSVVPWLLQCKKHSMLGQVFTNSTSCRDNASLLLEMQKIPRNFRPAVINFSAFLISDPVLIIGWKRPLRSTNPTLVFAWLPNYPNYVQRVSQTFPLPCGFIAWNGRVENYPCWSCLFPLCWKTLVPAQTDTEEEWGNLLVTLVFLSLETFDVVLLVIIKSCFVFHQKY